MSRLPTPGGDSGTWGGILNDFLKVEHNNDGTLKITGTLASKADDSAVVHTSGNETINGIKSFVTAPVVPSSSFPQSAVTNLTTDLASKLPLAGGTMTGKLVTPALQINTGANDGYVLTSDASGNAAWLSIPGSITTGPNYLRGVSLSGLEFGNSVHPGKVNINYFEPAAADYSYFKSKGLTVVRLPFLWERLQPYLNGPLDTTYKSYLDNAISYARTNGVRLVLDMHNFGRRYVAVAGGFTDDFTSSTGTWSGGSLSGGRYVSDQATFFTSFSGGDFRNPVSPASGYNFKADVYITADLTGGSNFPSQHIRVFDDGNNTYYQLSLNIFEQKFKWSKVVAGVSTTIGEVATTVSLNTLYQIEIDVNQSTAGMVTMKVNSVQIAQFATDSSLTGGKITFDCSFTKCAIDNVTLDINGDTTAAMTSGSYRVGDTLLPISAFADVWGRLATAYANDSTVWMYDLMNEPHNMPTPTTPSNYNTVATVTLMYQAAIDAIRAADTNKYIALEGDEWSGLQAFTSLYGSSPSAWWTDSASKTMVSFHYYFDTDHSGSYGTSWSSALRTRLAGEVTPALQWAQNNGIPLFVGEYGVPNGTSSDAVNWQQDEDTFLGYLDTYGAHATQWAGGSHYTASTTLEPFTSGSPDYTKEVEQMPIVAAHLGQQTSALPTTQGGTGLVSPGVSGNVLTSDGSEWISAAPSSASDATTSTKGIVQLAGDLGGTAAAPTVPGIAAAVNARPSAQGSLLAWNYDPALAVNNSTITAGVVYLIKVTLYAAATISNVGVYIITLDGGLTSGQCFAGLYDSSGNRVALTASQSGNWGTAGFKSMALTSSYSAAAGSYYVAFLANGNTVLAFARSTSAGTPVINAGLSAGAYRVCSSGTSQTSLPLSITLASSSANVAAFWGTLS